MEDKFESIYQMIRNFYTQQGIKPNVVLLGYEDYDELKRHNEFLMHNRVNAEYSTIFGIKIELVSKKNYLAVAYEMH